MPAKPSFLERMSGRRFGNIELPNESGQKDPRLKGTSVREALGKAREGIKTLQKKGLIGTRSPGGKR